MASTSHPTFDEKKDALWDLWRDDEEKRCELKVVAGLSEHTAELLISAWYDKEKSSFVEKNKKREEEAQKKAWSDALKRPADFVRVGPRCGLRMTTGGQHTRIRDLLYLPDIGYRTDGNGMGENGYCYRFHPNTLPIILKGLEMVHAEVTSNVKVTFEKFPVPEPETEEKKEDEEEDTEDLSEDEEEDVCIEFTVDGVEYWRDGEDPTVVRVDDCASVGVWNSDTETVDFDEEEDE